MIGLFIDDVRVSDEISAAVFYVNHELNGKITVMLIWWNYGQSGIIENRGGKRYYRC